MQKLLCAAALLAALTAGAGENAFLGSIVVSGASLNNTTTATPFAIPMGAKITVYCSAAVQMLVDNRVVAVTGALKGLPIPSTTLFPTSVGRTAILLNTGQTAVVAVIGTATCDFYLRDGNE